MRYKCFNKWQNTDSVGGGLLAIVHSMIDAVLQDCIDYLNNALHADANGVAEVLCNLSKRGGGVKTISGDV